MFKVYDLPPKIRVKCTYQVLYKDSPLYTNIEAEGLDLKEGFFVFSNFGSDGRDKNEFKWVNASTVSRMIKDDE